MEDSTLIKLSINLWKIAWHSCKWNLAHIWFNWQFELKFKLKSTVKFNHTFHNFITNLILSSMELMILHIEYFYFFLSIDLNFNIYVIQSIARFRQDVLCNIFLGFFIFIFYFLLFFCMSSLILEIIRKIKVGLVMEAQWKRETGKFWVEKIAIKRNLCVRTCHLDCSNWIWFSFK